MNPVNLFERHRVILSVVLALFTLAVIVAMDILAHKIVMHNVKSARKAKGYINTYHPYYNHGFKPNTATTNYFGPYEYPVFTNNLAMMDFKVTEVPLKTDKTRVIFIGDSLTEGVGFEYSKTFVGILDKKWQQLDVLNAATFSYSAILYYRRIEYLIKVIGLEFNHLVIFLDISDIFDNTIYEIDPKSDNVIGRWRHKEKASWAPPWPKKIVRGVLRNTLLLNSTYRLLTSFGLFPGNPLSLDVTRALWTLRDNYFAMYGKKGLESSRQNFEDLNALLKQKGIQFTLVVYPWPDQIYHRDLESKQVTYWRDWSQKNDVHFVNLFPYFINNEPAGPILDRFFIRDDTHFNEAGHEFMAKITATELESKLTGFNSVNN